MRAVRSAGTVLVCWNVMRVGTFLLAICLAVAGGGMAQPGSELDSLMATWPARTQIARLGPRHVVSWTPLDTALSRRRMLELNGELPIFQDDAVADAILLYGGPRRNHLELLLGMAAPWMPMIEAELKEAGLSTELKYLPLAMSAMNMQATSLHGEAGPWMLTFPVAVRYGLVVTDTIDERHDMVRSTSAAIAWLKDLNVRFGREDALLAYLCGPANLDRARRRAVGAKGIERLYPHADEDQRYRVPMFMALRYLALYADELGIKPTDPSDQMRPDTVHVGQPVSREAFARVLGIGASEFAALNPTLVGHALPANSVVRVPRGRGASFPAMRDSIVRASVSDTATLLEPAEQLFMSYVVEPGDNLGAIAEENGVSVAELMEWNELADHRIRVGQILRVRVSATLSQEADREPAPRKPKQVVKPERTTAKRTYVVRRGDTLSAIAKRYPGVSASEIMQYNGIGESIRPGQVLKIPAP